MSENKLNVFFVGAHRLSEFMNGFSVSVSAPNVDSFRSLDLLIFYASATAGSHQYLLVAKVSEVVLGGEADQYFVRASEARRVVFELHDASEEEQKRFWNIKRDYDLSLPGYQVDQVHGVVASDMLLFETGEKVIAYNAFFRDFISLESAAKLLAKSYGVDEDKVSIQICNRRY